jgi:hypothetical protein
MFLEVPFRFKDSLNSCFPLRFDFFLSFFGLGNELEGLEGWLLSFALVIKMLINNLPIDS